MATFDIEDWFHADNLAEVLPRGDWEAFEPRVQRNTEDLLDLLGETGATATFFVLGWIARRYPRLVRRMVDEGHEVASHSDRHRHLYAMSSAELRRDLAAARESLEQVTGRPVLGIRAPSFSISDSVLDCLAEAGYWYDSSLYAFGAHDRYGRLTNQPDADQAVVEIRPGLLELPLSRVQCAGAVLPWSGGGYFRIIPFPIYRWGVRRRLARRQWFMFYFHPWELDAGEKVPSGLRPVRRFRAYVGRHRTAHDLRRLIGEFGSCRIDETLRSMGYSPPGEIPAAAASASGGSPRPAVRAAAWRD